MPRPLILLVLLMACPATAFADIETWLKAGDARAGAATEQALATRPDDPAAWIWRIRWLRQAGRSADAVDLADRAQVRWPRDADVRLWQARALGDAVREAGLLGRATLAGRMREALRAAVALDPDQHDARLMLVEYYLQAPAIVGGSESAARREAAELARRDAARGHYARARLLEHEGRSAEALDAYLAAHAGAPGDESLRMAAGVALQSAGRWAEARALFRAWVHEDPQARAAWYQLGRIDVVSGALTDEGERAFRTVLSLPAAPGQPEPKHAWLRLGQWLAARGRREEAADAFGQALRLDPDFDEAAEARDAL